MSGTAWDYAAHRIINELALTSLPTNYPAFVQNTTARERIAFLGGEPDRWRNTPDPTFRHVNGPDHFLDVDDLPPYHLEPANLSPFRYEFVAQLVQGRAAHPAEFPPIDPQSDKDHTRALVGFLPWTICEHYSKLKSAFSCLKTFQAGAGTPEEVANAQQNVIYVMGVMGHFVGDAAQPLHTTKHYNGWVGANPNRYTTSRTFHAWIDGGFVAKAGLSAESLRNRLPPANLRSEELSNGLRTSLFPVVLNYLLEQSKLVEPLYRLEKEGKLGIEQAGSGEGTEFISRQLVKAAEMLGDLWLAAWTEAPLDKFLAQELARRNSPAVEARPTTAK